MRFYALIALFANIAVTGCSSQDPQDRSADSKAPKFVKADLSEHPEITLKHDFGFVGPNETLKHSFEIPNAGRSRWTLKEIKTVCSCTVYTFSSNLLDPGKSITVPVTYTPGSKSTDETRSVTVYFNEASSPIVRLLVSSRVRTPLTLSQNVLRIETTKQQTQPMATIQVENFSKHNWENLEVTCRDPWIQSTCQLTYPLDGQAKDINSKGPLQQWQITFTPLVTQLDEGEHQAHVTILGGNESELLPIYLRIDPKISFTPRDIILAVHKTEEKASRRVTVVFADPAENPTALEVEFDFGDLKGLTARWKKSAGRISILDLEWIANEKDEAVSGTLTVRMKNGTKFIVPVRQEWLPL